MTIGKRQFDCLLFFFENQLFEILYWYIKKGIKKVFEKCWAIYDCLNFKKVKFFGTWWKFLIDPDKSLLD